jgi:hypothetical protein
MVQRQVRTANRLGNAATAVCVALPRSTPRRDEDMMHSCFSTICGRSIVLFERSRHRRALASFQQMTTRTGFWQVMDIAIRARPAVERLAQALVELSRVDWLTGRVSVARTR